MTQSDRLRLAVFIDFDNIEIGVKNTVGASFDAGLVLEALKERGEVVSKTAYSDWQRAAGYSRGLTQHAIRMVQRNVTPGGDKNGADINLALDALEMAFTHPHINAFVIVGGDSDFISLVEKLKQYDKKVFVVGGRQFTSQILQRNCHEFIAYENLASPNGGRRAAGTQARAERIGIDQAIPLVRRALGVLAEREVSPQLGLLKSTLLQLDSTFSERNYGAGSFRDFAHKLEQAGVLKVHQAKGGWLVGPADGAGSDAGAPVVEAPRSADAVDRQASDVAASPARDRDASSSHASQQAPVQLGTAAEGVRELSRIIESAEIRRWPLYLRHIKQILKKSNGGFDERAYGFATLIDLLRAAGREGALRVERDRQGGLRVFQPTGVVQKAREPQVVEAEAVDASEIADQSESVEFPTETHAAEAAPVETTEPPIDETPAPAVTAGNRRPRARQRAATGTRTPRPARSRTRAKSS